MNYVRINTEIKAIEHEMQLQIPHIPCTFTEQDSNRKHSVRISIKTNDLGNARRQIAEKYHAENVLLTYVTIPDKEKI